MVVRLPLSGEWGVPKLDGVTQAAIRDYQTAFELMQDNLERDVARLWAAAERFQGAQRRIYLANMLFELQKVYGADATALAIEQLTFMRQGKELPVWASDVPLLEQVDSAVGFALSNPDSRALLLGAMQRLMMNSYRDTIIGSAIQAGRRFARVAEPGACDFCLMLASRGAVYLSKAKAQFVGATGFQKHYSDGSDRGYRVKRGRIRGSRPRDSKFHDNCKCHVIEVASDDDLPDSSKWLEAKWGDVTGGVDGSREKQLAWRKWLETNRPPWESPIAA